jgi:hypothetical protein
LDRIHNDQQRQHKRGFGSVTRETAPEEQLNIDEAEITDKQETNAGIIRAQSTSPDESDDTKRKTY